LKWERKMGTSSFNHERKPVPMVQLNFEKNITARWHESKREFRARFWEDIQIQVKDQVKQMIEELIQGEFSMMIGAEPYERSETRDNKRNGTYTRSFETPLGRIEEIVIPRARRSGIRFSVFDRWQQVDDQVVESMLQAYLLGRSASCAQKIIESFNHSRFSRGFLQRLTHRFEDKLQRWLERPIDKDWPYLFVDGMCVRIREGDREQRWCVLWVLGMDEKRNTEVLGFLLLKSESQEGAERLLRDLKSRGLGRPKLIITDDSEALENASAMVFCHTPQQGCIFHKVKATGKYLLNLKHKKVFLRQAADVYLEATGVRSLEKNLKRFKEKWRRKEPRALQCLLRHFERTITYLTFPREHWSWIRTTNPVERFIEGVREWTHRFGYFQGRGNLQIALFSYLCHKNPGLVPDINKTPNHQKDTILVA
jgi:putative transposase